MSCKVKVIPLRNSNSRRLMTDLTIKLYCSALWGLQVLFVNTDCLPPNKIKRLIPSLPLNCIINLYNVSDYFLAGTIIASSVITGYNLYRYILGWFKLFMTKEVLYLKVQMLSRVIMKIHGAYNVSNLRKYQTKK